MIWNYFKKTKEAPSKEVETTLFGRLYQGLAKTRKRLSSSLQSIFGASHLDEASKEQLLDILISSDVGPATSELILTRLEQELPSDSPPGVIQDCLEKALLSILEPVSSAPYLPKEPSACILLVGVNGVGKTTTIGRLAHYLKREKKTVYLAAGDTFRAAASEQLTTWAERNHVPITTQTPGADSAAVVFDAYQACIRAQCDVLLADTAGRLHNKEPLMNELAKVSRTLGKINPSAPHETWLVLDATVGQNGLVQAEKFHEALTLTGIVLTKLDGSAKGGIVFAIADRLKLPIRFLGVGEKAEDLQAFDPQSFVRAFLDITPDNNKQ